MRLPPYSKYKPTGIEWLGEIPEHWEVRVASDGSAGSVRRLLRTTFGRMVLTLHPPHLSIEACRAHGFDLSRGVQYRGIIAAATRGNESTILAPEHCKSEKASKPAPLPCHTASPQRQQPPEPSPAVSPPAKAALRLPVS